MTQDPRRPRPTPKAQKKRRERSLSRRRGPILRVLPMMIVTAVCLLGFRVTIVVQDMRTLMTSVNLGQSRAIAQEDTGARIENFENAALNGADTIDEDMLSGTEVSDATEDDIRLARDEQGEPLAIDPQSFTASELDLLQRLSERREQIDAQETEIATREAMLRAAETRIDGKISELQQLEQTLSELVAEADAQQQAKIDQLVRIYGAMKPKDAARIFNDLDMPILITVVEMMRENKVAPILAQMDAMKATAVTEALSMRKQMPGLQDRPQG